MVATDVGGVREIVAHGESGLVVPAGDVEALSVCIERLLPNAALLGPDDFHVGEAMAAAPKASNAGLLQTPRVYALNGSGAAGKPIEAQPKVKTWRDRVLVVIEVAALAGLIFVLFSSYQSLQTLNKEVVEARTIPATMAVALRQRKRVCGRIELSRWRWALIARPGGHILADVCRGAEPGHPCSSAKLVGARAHRAGAL